MNDKELREYRKRKFKCELTPAHHFSFEGEMLLGVTHNGMQWQSISLLPDEIEKVFGVLAEHLTSAEAQSPRSNP